MIAAFNTLMQRLMATHVPELNAVELTMSQTKALYVVMATGPLRMSELAARLGITSSSATGVVDGLVGLGLLRRHEDAQDRRQVVVNATAEAQVTLQRLRELNSQRMRELIGRLDADELAVVDRAMHILTAAVSDDPSPVEADRHPEGV